MFTNPQSTMAVFGDESGTVSVYDISKVLALPKAGNSGLHETPKASEQRAARSRRLLRDPKDLRSRPQRDGTASSRFRHKHPNKTRGKASKSSKPNLDPRTDNKTPATVHVRRPHPEVPPRPR